jgi:hypothetical protein
MLYNYDIGDRVKLGPREELTESYWKSQEVGTGIIIKTSEGRSWFHVRWEDSSSNCYHEQDLVLINSYR